MPNSQDALTQLDQLRTVNHHLRAALDQVDEAVVIIGAAPLDAPGPRIFFANRKAAELTGYPEEKLIGSPIGLIYEGDRLTDLLAKLPIVAEQKRTFQTDKQLKTKSGELLACRWTLSAMSDKSGTPLNYTLAFRERTERTVVPGPGTAGGDTRKGHDPIEQSRAESLALLTGGVAHDFNNVLTSVQANLSLARLGTSISSDIRKHIDDAVAAAESAQALTKQLLGFAKGRSQKRQKHDLGQLIKRSARLATMGSNIRWDLSIASSIRSVEVEETQIVQIFNNLLINARQAMPAGGVIQIGCENIDVTPDMGLKVKPGPYVVATVRDRGTGIPEDQLSKIFEPYFTTKPEGSGLGLATCYSAVQKHEGTITVRSKVNVGTEFNIYLPAVSATSEPSSIEPPRIIPGDGSILVVDDQDGVREVAVQILERLGYDAISATDGEEALRLYMKRMHSGEPISAILMDMTLPGGMSGDETLREIRRLDPNVRSIATSGYFEEDAEDDLRERGYKAMLPKPYTAEGLSVALQSALTS